MERRSCISSLDVFSHWCQAFMQFHACSSLCYCLGMCEGLTLLAVVNLLSRLYKFTVEIHSEKMAKEIFFFPRDTYQASFEELHVLPL